MVPRLPDRDAWSLLLVRAAELLWPLSRQSLAPGSHVDVASGCLRIRASRLLRACSCLVKSGYAVEASVLVRSLWEDAVSAAFILEKPAERAQKWVEFSDKRRVQHLRRALANPIDMSPEDVAKLAEAAEGCEAATCSDWAGTSASSLARGLSSSKYEMSRTLGRDFDLMYPDLCDVAHGSPFAVDRLLQEGVEHAVVDVGPTDQESADAPSLAVYAAFQLALAVIELGADIDRDEVGGLLSDMARMRRGS